MARTHGQAETADGMTHEMRAIVGGWTEAESSELPDPAHFHEVTFEVEELRVGFAQLVGKRDLGAEPEHRDRAVEERGLQDPGLVLASEELSGT